MTFTIGLIVCLSYFKTHPRARILNIGALDNLDKTRLINHLDEKMFFVLIDSDKNEFVGFQIDKYLGNSHYRVHYDTLAVHDTIPGMFVYPPGEMDSFYLSNTISSIHIDKLREKIYDSKDVYHDDGWFFEYEGDKDLFSRIDDSFAIFFIGGFLIFLGLLFLEIFIFLLRKYFNIDSRFWIYFIVLLLSILFYQNMIAAGLWPKVQIESFMRPIILMTPAFIIYQWHRIKKDSDLEFLPSQLIKFLLIFIVALISIFLAERFALYIAASEKRAVLMGHTTLTIAFIYSFALGNLLFNIARHGWSLRGANKNLAVAKKQVLSSESKLESLQSSVNPHFLYNSLNSIAALAKIDPERTEKMTLALSEFYKYNTNRDQNEMSSIGKDGTHLFRDRENTF
jgi:sensor histidine kinase YesM